MTEPTAQPAATSITAATEEPLETLVARMEEFAARREFTEAELEAHVADMWEAVRRQEPQLAARFNDPTQPADNHDLKDLYEFWDPYVARGENLDATPWADGR